MDRLTVPARLDALADLRRYARNAGELAGLEESRIYQLQLAVDEIATNIIVYGYKESAGAGITIRAEIGTASLVLTLEDRAPAFDPDTIPLPDAEDLARPLEERSIGGLGLYLVNLGVDRFEYRREGDLNLNILEVVNPGK